MILDASCVVRDPREVISEVAPLLEAVNEERVLITYQAVHLRIPVRHVRPSPFAVRRGVIWLSCGPD